MSDTVIKAENLSKLYRIGAKEGYKTFRETLIDSAKAPFLLCRDLAKKIIRPLRHAPDSMPSSQSDDYIWALKGVSFEVKQGEVVGIIGRNGAGKSTLLKILSKITEPTGGRVELRGRVGSLLEVGTGFHPELTGHENVYLYGAILGMDRWEVTRKFDEIIAFAELEKFVDTPVKRYSSGMYMRLAFAVAAHLEPEILLVDEVLAVGDAAFQKKCLGKMGDASKEGRTVLFVSHNMGAIQQLTNTSLLLHNGSLISHGLSGKVIEHYLNSSMDRSTAVYQVEKTPRRYPELRQQVEFLSLKLENYPTKLVPADADMHVLITVRGNECVERFRFSMTIYRIEGAPVGSFFGPEIHSIKKHEVATFRLEIRELRLAQGMYYCGLAIGKGNPIKGHFDFDVVLDVLHFEVMAPEGFDGTQASWYPGWGPIRFIEPKATRVK